MVLDASPLEVEQFKRFPDTAQLSASGVKPPVWLALDEVQDPVKFLSPLPVCPRMRAALHARQDVLSVRSRFPIRPQGTRMIMKVGFRGCKGMELHLRK